MGNMCAASQKLRDEPLAKGTISNSQCIATDGAGTKPVSLKMTSSKLVDANTGAALYNIKSRFGFNKLTITIHDTAGKLVCVAKGKKGFTTASFKVLRPERAFHGQAVADTYKDKRMKMANKAIVSSTQVLLAEKGGDVPSGELPLYEFAEGKIKIGVGTGTCTYSVVGNDQALVPLYVAKKAFALGFGLRVEAADQGALVGKVVQLGIDPSKVAVEVGAGVDAVAFVLLSMFVGAAVGSGCASTVGGLAGAGAI